MVLSSGQLGSRICPREETVSTLWNQLLQYETMHARGTPSCGKTTLGMLLQAHVERKRPDRTVYRITWPPPFPGKYSLLPYHRLLNDMLDINNWYSWEYIRSTLLIVGEAQLSYTYNTLWNDLIMNMPDSHNNNLFLLLLSSYGSPSAATIPTQPGCSPIVLSTQCRISIQQLLQTNPLVGLYFTRKEFDDMLRRYSQTFVSSGQPFYLSKDASNYVWQFINGHPSAVRFLLEYLAYSSVCRFP